MFKYLLVLMAVLLLPVNVFANSPVRLTIDQQLFDAIKKNDLALVTKAVNDGADINKMIYYKSGHDTPLTLAVSAGKLKIASFLLDNGAYVDAECQMPEYVATPLILATQNNDLAMVKLLIKHKADVNIANVLLTANSATEGKTPLIIALEHTYSKNPVSLPLVRLLLKNGANVNKADANGYTPMMAVANYHLSSQRQLRLQIAQELVAAGAEPNVHDYNSKSPLQYAYDNNFKQMVEFLSKLAPR